MNPVAPALAAAMAAAPAGAIGVAVSGGGDSVALLLGLRDWAAAEGRDLAAVTVDHGLRGGSAAEAEGVARICAALGVSHDTLAWRDWDRRGNLQDAARGARRRLIGRWAAERGVGAVALGHTLDDQAETFLLRLARGSGVDGLAAMAPASFAEGVWWLRPMLGLRRRALRRWLASQGQVWIEDPSNADPAFARVRARSALETLGDLGLGPERLAATAAAFRRARSALEAETRRVARLGLRAGPAGDLEIEITALAGAPQEIRLRVLAGALCWVAGARFRPRLARLETALAAALEGRLGRGLTLHGCVLRPKDGRVAVRREPAAVAPHVVATHGAWDGRWALTLRSPDLSALEIGALGAPGLAARPRWRASGADREALLTTPALWRRGRLVCAPVLDADSGVGCRRVASLPAPWEGDGECD